MTDGPYADAVESSVNLIEHVEKQVREKVPELLPFLAALKALVRQWGESLEALDGQLAAAHSVNAEQVKLLRRMRGDVSRALIAANAAEAKALGVESRIGDGT